MATTKAQQKAVDKYVKENYDSFLLRMKKGEKDKIKAHADSLGMSLNAFIVAAIQDKMGEKDD